MKAYRTGFTLTELLAATVVLAAVMVASVQVLGSLARQRRAAERRQWAMEEVANIMERLTVQPWDRLTTEHVQAFEISQAARAVLPDVALACEVLPEPGEHASKRITLELAWRDRAGEREKPVRLTAWIYRRGGRP
jgi:prepilin-type N-terminal cleavage/methylation domain-containing protein